MKNRTWIIIFAVVLTACAGIYFLMSDGFSASDTVGIYKDGKLVERVNLKMETVRREITLTGESGKNVIQISDGHIKMLTAECPDQVCVNHGELTDSGGPIVCLPNKVVIRWENSPDDYDVKAGV